MSKWKFIAKPDPTGHRFFELTAAHPGARVFICDESGADPDTCEDRHVHINRLLPIRIVVSDGNDRFIVPCIDCRGDPTATISSFKEVVYLCTVHEMNLEIKGERYKLTKVE